MRLEDAKTKDGRPGGVPEVNEFEIENSKRRYTYPLKRFPDLLKEKIVWDVGCGYGTGAKELIKEGAKVVAAVDFNKEAIKYAKEKNSDIRILYESSEINDSWFFNELIRPEVIIAVEIIEHFTTDELSSFFDLVNRKMDKGYLYISTPELRGRREDFPKGSHFIEYEFEELKELVESKGFKLVWHLRKQQTDGICMSLLFEK